MAAKVRKRSVHSKMLWMRVGLDWEDMATVCWDWPLPTVMDRGGSVVEEPSEVSSTNSPRQNPRLYFWGHGGTQKEGGRAENRLVASLRVLERLTCVEEPEVKSGQGGQQRRPARVQEVGAQVMSQLARLVKTLWVTLERSADIVAWSRCWRACSAEMTCCGCGTSCCGGDVHGPVVGSSE